MAPFFTSYVASHLDSNVVSYCACRKFCAVNVFAMFSFSEYPQKYVQGKEKYGRIVHPPLRPFSLTTTKFVLKINLSLINLDLLGQRWINGGSRVSLPCPVRFARF